MTEAPSRNPGPPAGVPAFSGRIISVMADSSAGPGSGADTEPSDGEARDWGRVLDIAGIAAGIALVLIVADILSDGRLISRRLQRRPPEDEPVDRD